MFSKPDQERLEVLAASTNPELHDLGVIARSLLALDAEFQQLRKELHAHGLSLARIQALGARLSEELL